MPRWTVANSRTFVRAPMPGLLLRIAVAAGDVVRRGEAIAIVEAMKMENELVADIDGRVEHVSVSAGDTVEKNQVLVELRPRDAGDSDG